MGAKAGRHAGGALTGKERPWQKYWFCITPPMATSSRWRRRWPKAHARPAATVDVKRVPETVPETVARNGHFKLDQQAPIATVDELPDYDAIVIGAPTRYGRMPSQMAAFLDQTGGLWARGALHGKVGAAFTSTATQHGGQETTLFSIITNLLHFGMVVVGLPYSFAGQMTLDEITGAAPTAPAPSPAARASASRARTSWTARATRATWWRRRRSSCSADGRRRGRAPAPACSAAALALPLLPLLDLANVAMLFLLAVVLVAIRLGRAPAVAAALVGVLRARAGRPPGRCARLRRRANSSTRWRWRDAGGRLDRGAPDGRTCASRRKARSGARPVPARCTNSRGRCRWRCRRSRCSRSPCALPRARSTPAVRSCCRTTRAACWPVADPGSAVRAPVLSVLDMAAAQWAYDHASAAAPDRYAAQQSSTVPAAAGADAVARRARGPRARRRGAARAGARELLDAFAALAAIALERVHYVDVAQDAVVRMEGERLRNSLLAALSHDLRTPLTSLVGLSESLALSRPPLAAAQMELANALRDEARRMSTLVANLLDMARIQSGGVKLNLQWQLVEETVGSALRACRWQLGARTVETRLPRHACRWCASTRPCWSACCATCWKTRASTRRRTRA
jgi:NAD(P)H:quinone oxidoreductase type IV